MVPRKFQASVLAQRMAGRDGGFFDASVQGGRGLCRAAAVHLYLSNNREGKTMITRRDFLKVTGLSLIHI